MKYFFLFLLFSLGLPSASAMDRETYFEVSPLVAFQSSDALRANTLGAFSLTFHQNRLIWFGADLFLGKTAVDQGSGLSVRDGKKFIGVNGAFYFNLPALLGASQKGADGVFADLYTSIGMGNYWLDQEKSIYGFLGGGMLVHTPLSWLSFRFDLKGLFYVLDNSQGGGFNSDMVLSLGPSLLF